MSTEIKNTLFRFVTMRSPELLEQEQIVKSFVSFPEFTENTENPITNIFLEAATTVPSNKTKAKALKDAADTFASNALKKRDELHSLNLVSKNFYDFAVWLTSNRAKLTVEKVNAMLSEVEPLGKFAPLSTITNEETINTLWENLLYQILTFKSGYVRDAILSVLVANFFLENYSQLTEATDEDLRKLAQARVIIPKIIFEKEDTSAKDELLKQALVALPLETKALEKELATIICKDKINKYQNIITELKKAQQVYEKANQKANSFARSEFEKKVQEAYDNADTLQKTFIDPETGNEKTYTVYDNLELPEFTFEKEPELSSESFTSKISSENITLINNLANINGYETFNEVINHYENTINIANQAIFENTTLAETQVAANGVILPTGTGVTNPNTFAIGNAYTDNTNPTLTLLFGGAAYGTDVVSATYQVKFDDNSTQSNTNFIDTPVNNKLSVKLFTEGINLSERTGFDLNGSLTLSDGRKIDFSCPVTIVQSPFSLGNHTITDEGTTTYLLKGKGTYQFRLIEFDPEDTLPEDTEESSNDGSVIHYIPSGFGIKRLGIADYRKVEQEICCYVPGEVSHIENVMASEYKEKSSRRMRRTENTTTTSNEKEIEKLTDTTSTDRFEMNQEVSAILSEQTSIGVHGDVRWGGSNGFSAGIASDFAHNISTEEANNQAVTQAKEVTERALDRVVQKVKEERISKIVEEFEENNKHGFDNRKNNQHVSGVYRWVDKIYRNKVVNYGKRLMYEFMIPQPAAFHNKATELKNADTETEVIVKPIDPRKATGIIKLETHTAVTESNYAHWASVYNVEVTPAPSQFVTVGKSFSQNKNEMSSGFTHAEDDVIKIPEGYFSKQAILYLNLASSFGPANGLGVGHHQVSVGGKSIHGISEREETFAVGKYYNEIPVSYRAIASHSSCATVEVKCELSPEARQKWQIETFNAIISAYEDRLAEYNAKMAELKTLQQEKVKTNPLFFRQIENTVLRKNCIEYLASHQTVGGTSLITGSGIKDIRAMYDSPELEAYSAKVKFFEQAFEWNLMSYNFYPFYWADKDKWADLYNISETDDPTFRAFLQSGMARVVVTIRPGFEEAVNWYMATGQVWNGGQVPTMDDPLFVSIVEELREPEGEVEETWESRVPTSLTVIQAGSIGLEVNQALPCDEDCADYKLFDSDGNPVLDGNGQQISTNPFIKHDDVTLQGVDNTTTIGDGGIKNPPLEGIEEEIQP